MYYYHLALFKQNTPLLVYVSDEACLEFDIVEVCLRNRTFLAVVINPCEKPDFDCKKLQKSSFYLTDHQKILAKFIAQYYCSSYPESFGILTLGTQETQNQIIQQESSINIKPLSENQKEALDFVLKRKLSLIFGDTGSGKSEIYFHLIAHHLKSGQNTLFLMPEISLTPQMEKRLKNAFGDLVAVWHSRILSNRKKKILEKINHGKIKIIAGARSALFLPIQNLGLIVVDEEHDDAYKSQSKPRYNARDLCIYLSKKSDVRVVLGSATPSPQSYFLAKNEGFLYRLKGGFFQSQRDFIFDSSHEILSPILIQSLKEMKQNGKQGIIFLPTRGNFKILLCAQCGESIVCKNCSITLSLHQKRNLMLCHYCGFSSKVPKTCPYCGGEEFASRRIGTAQLALELKEALPHLNIGIFDRDHVGTEKKLKDLTRAFKKREIDVLIGTQMVSKGHDYHNVWLSVVLEIDYLLKSPDFRCYERVFELLYQVAGRAGRRNSGRVLIQTANSDLIQRFLNDYEDFLKNELSFRKDLYPPFKKLIILHFKHKEDMVASNMMHCILEKLRFYDGFEIIGAERSGIEKLKGVYRYHILLRVCHQAKTLNTIKKIFDEVGGFDIDVDPIDLA